MTTETNYLIRAQEITQKESHFSHPWNPKSLVNATYLSRLVGLKRSGVNLVRIPSGKESFVYHSHQNEEEWIYIISGKGIAEIDGKEHEVDEGDFMGFPTPGVAHHMKNPFEEDLVYLVGGERVDVEVADFPRLEKKMIRYPDKIEVYNYSDRKGMDPAGK